jgi:glycosyltransferase involved in cell wall biosynthesis
MDNNKLDFLIIAPTPFYANRGCHMRIRGEAEALLKKGKSLLILTYKEGENVSGLEIIRSSVGVGGFGQGVAASWKNIPAGFFLFWTVLYETVYRHPKYLYGHLFEGAAVGIVVKYLAVTLSLFAYKPILILDAQDSLSAKMVSYKMLSKDSIPLKFFRLIEKFVLFFPDFIFTSSVQGADSLKKISPRSNPINLPDGISIFSKELSLESVKNYRGDKGKEKALIKARLSPVDTELIKKWLAEKYLILLYTGSYAPAKGFPDFVKKCMPNLLKNYNLRFLFGGGQSNDISHLVDIIKGYPGIIITQADLNSNNLMYFSLLGDIAIDCKPPITSESSGKILNYMAVGLPVVCFNQINNHSTLKDGGLVSKDYSEFTKNILKLANDPDLAQEMGEKNLRRSWDEFTWDRNAQKILDTIK